jgi:ubiquinone/menaquinone biosynthesis C-methylase UbiE
MNEFDIKAAEWDKNRMHSERAGAVAAAITTELPLNKNMAAMEFGAGTGLLSFMLSEHLGSITLIDNSEGMVKVLGEKLQETDGASMKIVKADLEHEDYTDEHFDLIYSLMVLHHVHDVETILGKFSAMLRPGGYLAIADLYTEDGSFHGHGFTGHKGFDTGVLASLLEKYGFTEVKHRTVYDIEKMTDNNEKKHFGVFLMTAKRKQ